MIWSVLSPPVLVAKYTGTEYKAILRLIDLWKVWEEMKRFGARRKNWEQRWCDAVTPMNLAHFSLPPCKKAVQKNYQTKQCQLNQPSDLKISFCWAASALSFYCNVCIGHMCLVSVQYRLRQFALNQWLPLHTEYRIDCHQCEIEFHHLPTHKFGAILRMLTGSTVLVTGCSRGLGLEMTKQLLSR